MTILTKPLVAKNIKKYFNNEIILKDVSMEADKGDVITLIGSSGSGKSTFLRCINLLETPDSGEIIINNDPIIFRTKRGHREPAKRKQVEFARTRLSMVFQGFNLWSHLTLIDNVIEAPVHVLGTPKERAYEEGMAQLDRVGLANRAGYFPAQLSGGQQQRGAIARALAMKPDVMLFDEPTSALDPELVGDVLRVMRDLADDGRTMVVVTHEMAFARDVSSHVIFLHGGRVEEAGSPEEIIGNPSSTQLNKFLGRLA